MIFPIIICGGIGTRLWPKSRRSMPKQFEKLIGEYSLYQNTIKRFSTAEFQNPVVIASEEHRFLVAQQTSEVLDIDSKPKIILEPSGKNTAPAALVACLNIIAECSNAKIMIIPSDHYIPDISKFQRMVQEGERISKRNRIVVFGVKPDRVETGYGYIEIDNDENVVGFYEKPEIEEATKMVAEENFFWNSGIFLSDAQLLVDESTKYAPGLVEKIIEVNEHIERDHDFLRIQAPKWEEVANISIDKAVMEKTKRLGFVKFDGMWSDLGDWNAIRKLNEPDKNGNVLLGKVAAQNLKNSFVITDDDAPLVAVSGLENILVVAMADAILISDPAESQNIRELVSIIKEKNYFEAEHHRRDFRPWGWFSSLSLSETFQVKCLHVFPNSSLSLQSHKHRSEHWVVVEGEATVQIDDKISVLAVNESTYIAAGQRHRLSNKTVKPLQIIEVQTGTYFGEDDIVRFEDNYDRN